MSRDMQGAYWIEPMVFTDVGPDFRIAREEIFGPVVSVSKQSNEAELLKTVSDTPYGLRAYGLETLSSDPNCPPNRRWLHLGESESTFSVSPLVEQRTRATERRNVWKSCCHARNSRLLADSYSRVAAT